MTSEHPKIASRRLLTLAKRFSRLANETSEAEQEFMALARDEFPNLDEDNDSIAENLTYGAFSNGEQTRERLTEIINGQY